PDVDFVLKEPILRDESSIVARSRETAQHPVELITFASGFQLRVDQPCGEVERFYRGLAMRDQLFYLEPGSGTTLQSRLRQMLVTAILQGQIPAGEALPSCRKLARGLSVARNTVSQAYQDLVDEGFLLARERRGYFVNGDILKGRVGRHPPKAS